MKSMLRTVQDGDARYDMLMFVCPGCAENGSSGLHMLPVQPVVGKPSWSFDGDTEAPTLDPSIATKMGEGFYCHSYLRGGVFEFLEDCTHSLAGQHVPLPELPSWAIRA